MLEQMKTMMNPFFRYVGSREREYFVSSVDLHAGVTIALLSHYCKNIVVTSITFFRLNEGPSRGKAAVPARPGEPCPVSPHLALACPFQVTDTQYASDPAGRRSINNSVLLCSILFSSIPNYKIGFSIS